MDTLCLSHEEDVDGICSAALIKIVKGCKVMLADYGDLLQALKEVTNVKEFYLCDLGISKGTFDPFVENLERISKFAKVYYIDHHPQTKKQRKRLEEIGIEVHHSLKECTSVLVYDYFKESLPREAAFLACYGAITDHMDDSSLAKKIISNYDRQFLLLEASLLSFAISKNNRKEFLLEVVNQLSKLKLPHRIESINKLAFEQLDNIEQIIERIKREGRKIGRFGYLLTDEFPLGLMANMAKGVLGVDVGIALKYKREERAYDVSLRASYSYKKHLGKIVDKLAKSLGGSGGGHAKASGCRINENKLGEFLERLKVSL
ncbi:MAG: DHH family phosphoesterase [Nitrososphaerales archaeon]